MDKASLFADPWKVIAVAVSAAAFGLSLFTWWDNSAFNKRQLRLKEEAELVKEWNSREMIECRFKVFKALASSSAPTKWSDIQADTDLHTAMYKMASFINTLGYLLYTKRVSEDIMKPQPEQFVGGAKDVARFAEDEVYKQFPYVFELAKRHIPETVPGTPMTDAQKRGIGGR